MKRFVLFLVDGLSSATLEEMLERGRLPTIARFKAEGSYHGNVVASFPTVTGPAHVPLFSGYTPATLNIIGHNQFIRREGRLENYLLHYKLLSKKYGNRPTLYHDFKNSVSISEPFRVGARAYRKNIFPIADWAGIRGLSNWYAWRTARAEYLRGRDLVVAWLHETDALAHIKKDPGEVEKSLISFDRFLATFEPETDKDTVIGLISDHGMEKTDARPFSVRGALERLGIDGKSFRFFLDGGGFAQVYFKKDGNFSTQLDETFLEKLPDQMAAYAEIDLVIHRRQTKDGLAVVVRSKRGRSSIARVNGHYHYRVENGSDPLGLVHGDHDVNEFALGQDPATCLRTSGTSNYPDGHYQVYELLAAPDSGDLVLTSAPNKGFNMLTRFGVHGGLNRAQAVTFMMFNRPVAGLDRACLRSADLPAVVRANLEKK